METFEDGHWVYIEPLNSERYCATAAKMSDTAYVFGGYNLGGAPTDTIEQYENYHWSLLEVKLPKPMVCVGAISIGPVFLIFGGNSNGGNENIVYKWDLGNEWEMCKQFPMATYFFMNQWISDQNTIHGYDYRGNKLEYNIDI